MEPELHYRVLVGDGHRDVRVTMGPAATVGDVADAVTAWTAAVGTGSAQDDHTNDRHTNDGPLTLAECSDRPTAPDPARAAADAAPPSGSTVHVVPAARAAAAPPWWSPASLHRLGADRADDAARLPYGTTVLGPARLRVGTTVNVQATGATDRLEVDGTPVRGSAAALHGSLLRIGDAAFVLLLEGPLRPPAGAGPWRHHPSVPAVVEHHSPGPVELPTPPEPGRTPGFPVLSAAVPLLMGAAMWVATKSFAVAGFVLFSVAFVVASGIELRREHTKERRFREQAFEQDLRHAVERAGELRTDERRRADRDLPSGPTVAGWALDGGARIWERTVSSPIPLRVRIGTQATVPSDPVVAPAGGRADLRDRIGAVLDDLGATDLPAAVDLATSGLAVAGTGDGPAALVRSVLVQLCGLIGPDRLELVTDVGPERRADWDWLHWLPHRVADPVGSNLLVDRGHASSRRLVVHLQDGTDRTTRRAHDAVGCIRIAATEADIGPGFATVVIFDGDRAWSRRDDGPRTALQPDAVAADLVEPTARALAPLRCDSVDDDVTPVAVALRDVLADPTMLTDPGVDVVRRAWARSRQRRASLGAPIGCGQGGIVPVDLRADGPHGLIAGTTGAGKSELLRTLVTSLALHHPPDRLTFLLVDYKGGAAFRPVAGLPHVVGLVTDLGPSTARRALVSLRAETRRRERLVADAGVADLSEVGPGSEGAPALVVVVDEFATLARELPELLDGLLDVAQRGRSLGIHLLLATQRPAGVVTEAVRANLSLRLALRVADEDDSRDVVDAADAAHLPADRPGRAVLRLAPGRVATLQVAVTSGPAIARRPATCADLHEVAVPPTPPGPRHRERVRTDAAPEEGAGAAPGADGATRTEVAVAVERCRRAAALDGVDSPPRPWVDPLPAVVPFESLVRTAAGRGRLPIGLVDRPGQQRRDVAGLDLGRHGGVLVLGPPRSGRSTTLRTVAAAAIADPHTPTVVYALDGGRDLLDVVHVRGPGGCVGDVVAADDVERTLRMLRRLREHVRSPIPSDERTVLLVDGIAALVERHDRINRGEAIDLLVALGTDGPGRGVHLAVSAGRIAEVPAALAAALDRHVALRPDVANDTGRHGDDAVDAEQPPGRAVIDGEVVQIAVITLPGPDADGRRTEPDRARSIGSLPTTIAATSLPDADGWRVPIGVGHADLGPAALDLTHHGALVLGPPRSGRTSALRTLAERLRNGRPDVAVVWIDGAGPEPERAAVELERLIRGSGPTAPHDGHRTLVVVDDVTELLDGPDGIAVDRLLDELVRQGRARGVRVALGAEADAAARCYADSVRRLRSGRTGILLRPDPDLHPGLLHTALPRHDDLPPAPGRGWIVGPDAVTAVQLAR